MTNIDDDDICHICCEPQNIDNQIKVECCLKLIHVRCLYKWIFLTQKKNCPFCRHLFTTTFNQQLNTQYNDLIQSLVDFNSIIQMEAPRIFQLNDTRLEHYPFELSRIDQDDVYTLSYYNQWVMFEVTEINYLYEPIENQLGLFTLFLDKHEFNNIVQLSEYIHRWGQHHDYTINKINSNESVNDFSIQIKEAYKGAYRSLTQRTDRDGEFETDSILSSDRGTGSFEFWIKVKFNGLVMDIDYRLAFAKLQSHY